MNKIKGVITGDIIDSSAIQIEYRDFLLESMRVIVNELSVIEPLKIEFFRGDSFQMVIDIPENALKIATCRVKKSNPEGQQKAVGCPSFFGGGNHILPCGQYCAFRRRGISIFRKRT